VKSSLLRLCLKKTSTKQVAGLCEKLDMEIQVTKLDIQVARDAGRSNTTRGQNVIGGRQSPGGA
jgi:hypothetical protein